MGSNPEPQTADEFFRKIRESNPGLYRLAREKFPDKDRNGREIDTAFQEEVESVDAPTVKRKADRELYRQWMAEQWS